MKKDQEFRLGEEIEVGGIKWTIYFMSTSEVRCIASRPVCKRPFNTSDKKKSLVWVFSKRKS